MIVQHRLVFRDYDDLFFRKVPVVEYGVFSLRGSTPQVLHLNFWLPLALNPFLMIEYAIRPGAYNGHGLFYFIGHCQVVMYKK